MSKLTKLQKEVINKYVGKNNNVLEVFVGDSNESINFFREKSNFFGFGNYPLEKYNLENWNYTQINCPPFPSYKIKFSIIFICELCWVDDMREDFSEFLKNSLKEKGFLIITRSDFVEVSFLLLDCIKKGFRFSLIEFFRESEFETIYILQK